MATSSISAPPLASFPFPLTAVVRFPHASSSSTHASPFLSRRCCRRWRLRPKGGAIDRSVTTEAVKGLPLAFVE
ncbi:hypothetical protein E2562_021057 [Oryza meyeriana var. granulata]|uniref:Uncharacterized protein n=1 Tax=Oryza meyeriana var. granulata TaxID=110450 RepID=A0A6G1FAP8_9ORYZ|nr:hypothetical protein E2562_021057 [Oryza meyeriana var. granulata]